MLNMYEINLTNTNNIISNTKTPKIENKKPLLDFKLYQKFSLSTKEFNNSDNKYIIYQNFLENKNRNTNNNLQVDLFNIRYNSFNNSSYNNAFSILSNISSYNNVKANKYAIFKSLSNYNNKSLNKLNCFSWINYIEFRKIKYNNNIFHKSIIERRS